MVQSLRKQWLCAVVVLLAARVGVAQLTRTSSLDSILEGLGSSSFSQRESAQAELGRLSPDQMEQLRAAAEQSREPEVKARLQARVDEMEIYRTLHPKPVSVNVENVPVGDVIGSLNRQMGQVFFEWADKEQPKVTLKADNQPVWEILRQLNLQVPFDFTISENFFSLRRAKRPWRMAQVDGMGILYNGAGDPKQSDRYLVPVIYLDPRVRIVRYITELQDVRGVDQNGDALSVIPPKRSLTVVTPPTPASSAMGQVHLKKAPGPNVIRDFRAIMHVELLVKEETLHVDLSKLPWEPRETREGRLTIERAGNGDFKLGVERKETFSPLLAPNHGASFTVKVFEKSGTLIDLKRGRDASGGQPLSLGENGMSGRATRLEIIVPSKTLETTLSIILHDVPLDPLPGRVPPS